MQARDVALEVVEAVARGAARRIQVDAVKRLHDVNMIRDFIIRNDRVAKALKLDVLGVVLADRDRGVDDIRNDHHAAADFLLILLLVRLELLHLVRHGLDLGLDLFGLILQALGHQAADLLGLLVALGAQLVAAGLGRAELGVKVDDLIDQRQLFVLELLLDVFLDCVRVLADKFDIQHGFISPSISLIDYSSSPAGPYCGWMLSICSLAASNSLLISAPKKSSSVLPNSRSSLYLLTRA